MIEFIVGVVLGMVVTGLVLLLIAQRLVNRASANIDAIAAELKQLAENIIPARVEQHDGVFYVYNTRDGSFIAQGTSIDEIKHRIEERMKDATVMVTEGDTDVLQKLKDTKVETTHA